MAKQDLLRGLHDAIRTAGFSAGPVADLPTIDTVIKTPCFAAFFKVVEEQRDLESIHEAAQSEISSICGNPSWPRDLELVLLAAGGTPPDAAALRRVVDDRYICRKFVLNVNGGAIRDVLTNLPFWPAHDLLSKSPTSVASGVQEVVTGYDSRLIADFASHSPGAERVCEKIREGAYSLSAEAATSKAATLPRVTSSVGTKLEALDIVDFRGIRRLRPEDMPLSGDVIFIYGPNGVGKTSIADAVEWVITGEVSRLEQRPVPSRRNSLDPVVNVFSDKGETQITCHLSSRDSVSRAKHGHSTKRMIGSSTASDDRTVIDHVVGTKAPSPEARLGIARLRDLFRGSHMLAQHDIRQFLEGSKATERFDILTNMIGAEEFVRFREKVATVLRSLRSHAKASNERCTDLNREMEDLSARWRARREEFEGLSHVVTAGKTPEDVASELLKGLRSCQCSIDEDAVHRAGDESPERRFELLAVHAEAAIRGKKVAVEDFLVRVNGLEQELQGYVESRRRCQNLAAEIATAKEVSEKTRPNLQKQETARQERLARLQANRTKQSEAAKRYADLTWLKEKVPAYRLLRETLKRSEDSLASQREELQKSDAVLEEQQESLTVKQIRLQEIEKAILLKMNRGQALAALLTRLDHAQAKRQDAERFADRERELDSRISELTRQANTAREEVNSARSRMAELQRAYDSEAARHDVLSSFLAKLAEMVHSAECPLCGRGFATAQEAKDSIREHLSAIPVQLKDLARRVDEVKKDIETKQAHADSVAAGIRALEAETEKVRSGKAEATKGVRAFLADCGALAITVSEDDASSWGNALGQASNECDVGSLRSEAASLRDAIKSLTSRVAEQRNVTGAIRQRLLHEEKQRDRLMTEAQGLEADLVRRGIDPGSIPVRDRLHAELSKEEEEARESAELVGQGEVELRGIESSIAGLRESLKRVDEDVASKEFQLQQYETTRSRFIAACRAVGVDPENATESFAVVKQSTSELNKKISRLEEKRQVLQQVASLGRLKLEVDRLERAEGDLKRQAEASGREEARLREWVSRVEGLEAEVVKRQVDAVGTHLQRLEPTTQGLYHRLNPHPIFGKVRIRVDEKTRELDVEAEASVAHKRLGGIAVSPSAFFSDAQMNALAITVFLAGALRQRWSAFNTVLIDDPVQQMDEMNVCAFLDLIRGLSTQRQFIVFTCSRDFYLLALDKLICLNESKRGSFLAYRLEGIAPANLRVHCDAP